LSWQSTLPLLGIRFFFLTFWFSLSSFYGSSRISPPFPIRLSAIDFSHCPLEARFPFSCVFTSCAPFIFDPWFGSRPYVSPFAFHTRPFKLLELDVCLVGSPLFPLFPPEYRVSRTFSSILVWFPLALCLLFRSFPVGVGGGSPPATRRRFSPPYVLRRLSCPGYLFDSP